MSINTEVQSISNLQSQLAAADVPYILGTSTTPAALLDGILNIDNTASISYLIKFFNSGRGVAFGALSSIFYSIEAQKRAVYTVGSTKMSYYNNYMVDTGREDSYQLGQATKTLAQINNTSTNTGVNN